MNKQKGFIVSFTDKRTGKARKAFVYYHEQTEEFENSNRFFCHMVNDDLTPCEIDGKKVVGLKHQSEVSIIGYLD